MRMQKITPFLRFDGNAEKAAKFYVSVFRNAKMGEIFRMAESQPDLTIAFELEGLRFHSAQRRPSIQVHRGGVVRHQLRVRRGARLPLGQACRWRHIPDEMVTIFGDKDRDKASRAMQAMMQMKKIDLQILRKAFAG